MAKQRVPIRMNEAEGNSAVHIHATARQDYQACRMRKLCTHNNKMEKHGRAGSIRLEDDCVYAFLARMDSEETKTTYKTPRRSPNIPTRGSRPN